MVLRVTFALLMICTASAKTREWMDGTVAAINHVSARLMKNSASVEYTIRTDRGDYVLEDAAFTYYTGAPKDILSIGDVVQLSPDGSKHALLKAGATQKRLRLIRVSKR